MEKGDIISNQNIKVDEMYRDSRQWKSSLQFMNDEIIFINHLLNSYLFQPNTFNLFERLQDFQERMKISEDKNKTVIGLINKHENTLGGMLECRDNDCDVSYYNKHDKLKNEADKCLGNFQNLKREIFNYAGGIMKKRKQP